jgi:hypothetical protein
MRRLSLKWLCLIVVAFLAAGAVSADCGVKDTYQGKLKAVDAEKNQVLIVVKDGKEVELELTDESKVMDAEGNKAMAKKLVGKNVKVISEHGKIDSIEQVA